MDESFPIKRRTLIKAAGAAALGQAVAAALASPAGAMPVRTRRNGARTVPVGKPGEFDFLDGRWKVAHRMLDQPTNKWIDFTGTARCWTILGGVGSVEELSVPTRKFQGMGLRLLDVKARVWSDFWVNAQSGVLTTPGTTGGFENGVGTFIDESDAGKPEQARGVWDQITKDSCRWRQGITHDGGKTWTDNWIMHWTRA